MRSFFRLFPSLAGHALILFAFGLARTGGEELLELLHTFGCDCCIGADDAKDSGCCSKRAPLAEGPTWSQTPQGCACTSTPQSCSGHTCAAVPVHTGTRGDLARSLGAAVAPIVWASDSKRLGHAVWARARSAPSVGLAGRFRKRSGGERAALLGCARL